MKKPNWTRILTILLVVLAGYAVLYITGTVLDRFRQAILLFVLGGILAYILTPLVNRLEAAFHFRALAILLAYLFVATALFALGVLLFTPFIQQSQSLVENLRNPSTGSLTTIGRVEKETTQVSRDVKRQIRSLSNNHRVPSADIQRTRSQISMLRHDVRLLSETHVSGRRRARSGSAQSRSQIPPSPSSRTRVPSSYIASIKRPLAALELDYGQATQSSGSPDLTVLHQAGKDAQLSNNAATHVYHVMSTSPLLLLYGQTWADDHNIHVDLASKFGQASQQISNQGTNILNNAITILSETANILLDTTLVLIISFYLLGDSRAIIRGTVGLIPSEYREQVWFFMGSLDQVLGGYIRGQLFLAALAGVLGGGGAAVLGVPYPLLIGITTFLLQLVPVIGPLVAVIPAVLISLFFTPILTTFALLAWFLVFQQIVTNVLGPRIMGIAVGIHPLEALLAVLVGYPLGGLLGAFLAVPLAGVIHILVREAYNYFVLGGTLPTAPVPEETSSRPEIAEPVAKS